MSKRNVRPSNLLNPVPAVLISCTDESGNSNVMTAAWVGTICSDPVMLSVSIRKSRYTHEIISKTKEFVVNLTNEQLVLFTDYVGIYSGRKIDKFNLVGPYKVTPVASKEVKAVSIDESPVCLECRVKEILELGSHDCFIAEVVNCAVDENLFDDKERINLRKANLISYCHGEYYALGRKLGKFGFSAKRKERNRRNDLKQRSKKKTG